MRAGLRVATCLGLVLVGIGCTSTEPGLGPETESSGQVAVEPEDEDRSSDTSERDIGPCDDGVVAAIDTTIAGQLAAFAADDFDAALEFASRSFRSGVDAASFRTLILEAYPTLTDDAVHRSGACLITAEGVAEIRIEVTGDGGTRDDHVYLMVEEDDRWLVQAAATPDGSDHTIA